MSATGTEAPTSGTVRTSYLLNTGEHVAARSGHYFETTEASYAGSRSTRRTGSTSSTPLPPRHWTPNS